MPTTCTIIIAIAILAILGGIVLVVVLHNKSMREFAETLDSDIDQPAADEAHVVNLEVTNTADTQPDQVPEGLVFDAGSGTFTGTAEPSGELDVSTESIADEPVVVEKPRKKPAAKPKATTARKTVTKAKPKAPATKKTAPKTATTRKPAKPKK